MVELDVWLPRWGSHRAELMNRLNTPGAGTLGLPFTPWPADFDIAGWEDFHLRVEDDSLTAEDVIGPAFNFMAVHPRTIASEDWNDTHTEHFVSSIDGMEIEVGGRLCIALAALSACMTTSIVAAEATDTGWRAWLCSYGDVTVVDIDRDQLSTAENFDPDRPLGRLIGYFLRGPSGMELKLPGVTVVPPKPVNTIHDQVLRRQTSLREWQRAVALGTVPVVEGAQVAATDFVHTDSNSLDPARPVIARAAAAAHIYELIHPVDDGYGPLEVLCAVDGQLQDYSGPAAAQGRGAQVPDWADWILRHSTEGGVSASIKPWDGDGQEAMLYRVAHNIVGYAEHEASVEQFNTADELRAWLTRALGNHNAPLTVCLVDPMGLAGFTVGGSWDHANYPFERHVYERSNEPQALVQKHQTRFWHPWDGTQNWAPDKPGTISYAPILETYMDGADLESYEAVHCLDDDLVNSEMLPDDKPVTFNSWFMIRLHADKEMATAIPVPASGASLIVVTDQDGAAARITVQELSAREEALNRELAFREQWAAWLGENPLTREQIADGLDTVARLIREQN